MTVAELKKILESVPDDYKIVLSIDPEGNAYHEVYIHGTGQFIPPNEVACSEEDAMCFGEEEYNEDCLILWPY